jgi:uncharacterized membrane protein HdeD (DUF308 family)
MQPKYAQITIGVISLVIGIILLVRAHDMAHAIGDQVQQAFTGAPSDRTTYFQIAGWALTIFGAVYILLGVKPKSKS